MKTFVYPSTVLAYGDVDVLLLNHALQSERSPRL